MSGKLDRARAALQQRYRSRLASHAADLCAALDAQDEATIRTLAHRLQGSGGSYGYPDITEAAAKISGAPASELPAAVAALIAVLESHA